MKDFLRFIRNAFSKDETRKLNALSAFGRDLFPCYRFSWPEIDWWKNEEFNDFLERFNEADSYNSHRRWMVHQLVRLVDQVPGDTAECGVYLGASSYLICAANAGNEKSEKYHHCFDSFEGLSEPSALDGSHWSTGNLSIGETQVHENLSRFANVKLYKGWIPDRFNEVSDRRFSFVHIDVDLHDPTRDSIAFFYEKLNPGGILLCDDYGFSTCPGATAAIDEFLSDKPEEMIKLGSGGGFFIKGVATATDASLAKDF